MSHPSADAIIVRLCSWDKKRFLHVFGKKDLDTKGGQALFTLQKKHRPLSAIAITNGHNTEIMAEAKVILNQAKSIDVKELEDLASLVIRKKAIDRLVETGLEAELDVDVGKVVRDFTKLNQAELGEQFAPKKGEWKVFLKDAWTDKGRSFTTGLKDVDLVLEGGLMVGELGILMGPTNVGKTYSQVHIGVANLLKGINVLHFTPQLSRTRLLIRYIQNTLNLNRQEVLNRDSGRISRQLTSRWKGSLRVLECVGGTREFSWISKQIHRFGEGLILLDSFEDLRRGGSVEGWKQILEMAIDIRDVAAQARAGIWVTSQTNRSTLFAGKRIELGHTGESIGKVQVADVVIALQSGLGDREQFQMEWDIQKARERLIGKRGVMVRSNVQQQRFEDIC